MDQLFLNPNPVRCSFAIPPPPPLAPLSPIKITTPSSATWKLPPSFRFPLLPFPVHCEELYTSSFPATNHPRHPSYPTTSPTAHPVYPTTSPTPHPVYPTTSPTQHPLYPTTSYPTSSLTPQLAPLSRCSTTENLDSSAAKLDNSCSSVLELTAVKQELLEEEPKKVKEELLEHIPRKASSPPTTPSQSSIPVPAKTTSSPPSRPRMTSTDNIPANPSPEYRIAICLTSSRMWGDLLTHISVSSFPPSEHPSLQKLWFSAVYSQHIETKKKPTHLSPAIKYRLRKQNPIPASISSVNPSTNNYFSKEVKSVLEGVFLVDKRPNPETVRVLCDRTGLTAKQIRNFFKNKRSRS